MNFLRLLATITILTLLSLTIIFLYFICVVDLYIYPHEFFVTGIAYFLTMLFGIVTAGECGRLGRVGK